MGTPEENVPLINGKGAEKEPRTFRGHPVNPFGDCGATDAAACCLAFNAPHVAFGFNASRGLGLTWWKECLKLLVLTCGIFTVVRLAIVILVHTSCHAHHHAHGAHPVDPMPMVDIQPLANIAKPYVAKPGDNAAVTYDVATGKTTVSSATHTDNTYDMVESDDIGEDVATVSDAHDPSVTQATSTSAASTASTASTAATGVTEPAKKPCKYKNRKEGRGYGMTWQYDPANQAASTEPYKGRLDDDDDHDDHHHHHHHHKWHHDLDDWDDIEDIFEFDDVDAKCIYRVAPWVTLVAAFGLAVLVYATYYAAVRRTMLRERFGIEGSFKRDWLLWACCGPCALTQETRTLMHNNVVDGMWHGPLSAPAPAAPMAV